MYSIVLLAAMTTGADLPACHRGGCCGEVANDCGGCHGGHRLFGGLFGGHRHHGCCGAPVCGCCGAPAPACGCCGAPAPAPACGCCGSAGAATPPAVEEKDEDADDEKEMPKKESKANAPARMIVSVPAAATVTIDGASTKSTGARRVFVSPTLTVGKVYTYTLEAQVNDETVSKTVEIRAGATTTVDLTTPASVASR